MTCIVNRLFIGFGAVVASNSFQPDPVMKPDMPDEHRDTVGCRHPSDLPTATTVSVPLNGLHPKSCRHCATICPCCTPRNQPPGNEMRAIDLADCYLSIPLTSRFRNMLGGQCPGHSVPTLWRCPQPRIVARMSNPNEATAQASDWLLAGRGGRLGGRPRLPELLLSSVALGASSF
jgi:hypothetical protein